MSNPVLNQITVDDVLYDMATQYAADYITDIYINGLGELILVIDNGTDDAESLSV